MTMLTPEASDPIFVCQVIGTRGKLTRHEAKSAARLWKETLEVAPNAQFIFSIGGYDDDPRELWEFEEVKKFVQQFARFAGIKDVVDYQDRLHPTAAGFLIACGAPCREGVTLIKPPPTVAQ